MFHSALISHGFVVYNVCDVNFYSEQIIRVKLVTF